MTTDPKSLSNFVFYTTLNGDVKINVTIQDETLWLTQKMLATLFDVDTRTISEHLQNIFKTGELIEEGVIRKFRITASDGKKYDTSFYKKICLSDSRFQGVIDSKLLSFLQSNQ